MTSTVLSLFSFGSILFGFYLSFLLQLKGGLFFLEEKLSFNHTGKKGFIYASRVQITHLCCNQNLHVGCVVCPVFSSKDLDETKLLCEKGEKNFRKEMLVKAPFCPQG